MSPQLTEKKGAKSTTFIIEDTGLLIKTIAGTNETEQHFPFEQIGTDRATFLYHNKGMLTMGFVFMGIGLFTLISDLAGQSVEAIATPLWISISVVLFAFYFRTRKKTFVLQTTDNKNITFYANSENPEAPNTFIEQIIAERNIYLVSKYGILNKNLDFGHQLENLNWLLNNRALSKNIMMKKCSN